MKRSGYFREHSTSLQMTCTTFEKALIREPVALFRTSGLIRLKTEYQNATCRCRASFYPQDRGVFTKEMEEVNLHLARECTLRKTSANPLAEKQIVGIYLNRQPNRDSQKRLKNMNEMSQTSKELGNSPVFRW